MRFLTDKDYRWMVEPEDFAIIAYGGDDYTVLDAEDTAAEEIKKIIRGARGVKFDLDALFFAPEEFDIQQSYSVGDFVYVPNLSGGFDFYTAVIDVEFEPITNETFWKKGDKRDKTIKKAMVVFSTYFLHQHIPSKFIPERYEKMYTTVKKELEEIRDGKLVPKWPMVVVEGEEKANQYYHLRSNPRRKFYN